MQVFPHGWRVPPGGPSGKLQDTHPPVFHAHSQHDDDVYLLLPHQPPEVLQRLFKRPLGGNELLWLAVALRCEDTLSDSIFLGLLGLPNFQGWI